MNWEAVGSLAETVGAVGVIGTLIYIAIQVRQTNRNLYVDAHQQVVRDYESHHSAVVQDENVEAFIKGLNNYSSLNPEERAKFDFCLAGYVNLIEETIYQADAGRLGEVLEMWRHYLGPRIFAYSGFRDWWVHGNRAGFAESTQTMVDTLIELNKDTEGFWEYL